jgi:hypothetical protein
VTTRAAELDAETDGRRPQYWLKLTDELATHSTASIATKLVLGIATALPGHDPSSRSLEKALPFKRLTIIRARTEAVALALARTPTGRRADRTRLTPSGSARPGNQRGQGNRWAVLSPVLLYGALDACAGRRIGAHAPIVLHRLIREQSYRGAAQVPVGVLRYETRLNARDIRWIIGRLTDGRIIARHASHASDSDEAPIFTVPEAVHTPDLDKLDSTRTRELVPVRFERSRLTIVAHQAERTALDAIRAGTLHGSDASDEQIETEVARFDGQTIPAGRLLDALRLAAQSAAPAPLSDAIPY